MRQSKLIEKLEKRNDKSQNILPDFCPHPLSYSSILKNAIRSEDYVSSARDEMNRKEIYLLSKIGIKDKNTMAPLTWLSLEVLNRIIPHNLVN